MINEQSPITTSVIDGILWGVVAYVCCVCGIVVEGGMDDWTRIGPFEARWWMHVLVETDVDIRAQRSLFLLAQYNPEGARHANQAVGHLTRLQAEDQIVKSASSVIQGAITTSLNTMKEALQMMDASTVSGAI